MNIAIISPHPAHLEGATRTLEAAGHAALSMAGGVSRIAQVLAQSSPDVLLVDGVGQDLAELGAMEQALALRPGLTLVLMCAQPKAEFLVQAMRLGVREVLPSPAPAAQLLAALARLAPKPSGQAQAAKRGRLLAFMPCKGGSGASFLAANLGWQLGQTASVLLMDLNLQFGDALSQVHEDRPPFTVVDVARDLERLDAALLAACSVKVSPGFAVLAAPEEIGDAVDIRPEHIDALIQLALRQHDFVLLDLGRNLDLMNIKVLDQLDQLFVVMQAGLPWLRHAKRLQRVLRSLDCPDHKIEWVVNRFEKSAAISLDEITRTLGTDRLRLVANDYREVNQSVNQGSALGACARSSRVSRQLAELAQSLAPRPASVQKSLFGQLFGRG